MASASPTQIALNFCGLVVGLVVGIILTQLGHLSRYVGGGMNLMALEDLGYQGKAQCCLDRGTGNLPPNIIVTKTDLYQRRLWGDPAKDLPAFPSKYLVTFTVGIKQKANVNASLAKFPKEWTILLFHYDGNMNDWDEFEWSKTAIHISVQKQTKWWFAKRFLHPDVVAPYDYIFIWDEDLGVEHFDADKYMEIVKRHGLEISQPGLDRQTAWEMTKRREEGEIHHETKERPGWCPNPHLPPCAGFVEIMAPVFSSKAWRCVWHMIQNDLVHGWGLDLNMGRCVESPHKRIGVVDTQWIKHKNIPSLGQQGIPLNGKTSWQMVRARCNFEWHMYKQRIEAADKALAESGSPHYTNRW